MEKWRNWRNWRNDQNKICETCKYYNKDASFCLLTNTLTTPTSTCNNWTPKEEKQKEAKGQETKPIDQDTKGQEVKNHTPGLSCKDCKHHDIPNNKCLKRPEWAFVSPFHLACELFEPKEERK